jgi:hypothetical protein
MKTLIRPCLPQLKVDLAERGQRQVEGPLLGWIKFGTRFLCRSRLIHTTSRAMQRPWRDPRSSYVENKKRRWGGPTPIRLFLTAVCRHEQTECHSENTGRFAFPEVYARKRR